MVLIKTDLSIQGTLTDTFSGLSESNGKFEIKSKAAFTHERVEGFLNNFFSNFDFFLQASGSEVLSKRDQLEKKISGHCASSAAISAFIDSFSLSCLSEALLKVSLIHQKDNLSHHSKIHSKSGSTIYKVGKSVNLLIISSACLVTQSCIKSGKGQILLRLICNISQKFQSAKAEKSKSIEAVISLTHHQDHRSIFNNGHQPG
ncbi:MAG: hypothetical protein U9Q66_02970 [Patescibacteria group bacterium]|nr:hypothetical protein [Patescibacteria group bacterium]